MWRIQSDEKRLVCAVGSRNGTEETKLLVFDFDCMEDENGKTRCLIKNIHGMRIIYIMVRIYRKHVLITISFNLITAAFLKKEKRVLNKANYHADVINKSPSLNQRRHCALSNANTLRVSRSDRVFNINFLSDKSFNMVVNKLHWGRPLLPGRSLEIANLQFRFI